MPDCKCAARIVALEPQPGGPDPMFVEGALAVVHEPLDIHARAEAMETALREIRDHPHCTENGDKRYINEHEAAVSMGVIDGHRCAAKIAKAALDGSAS